MNRRSNRQSAVRLSGDGSRVIILDQSLLPNREVWLEPETAEECFEAIRSLKVRGAPAIGVFAGYALYVLARGFLPCDTRELLVRLHEIAEYLKSARPTAVNLAWALERMERKAQAETGRSAGELCEILRSEAIAIDEENLEMTRRIASYGLELLKDGDGILTHCNAGCLGCLGYGSALAPIYLGIERGMHFHVFADETRPLLQGARLTAYELQQAGVDVTLICDNMAATVMKQGKIQAVLVGCDRIAANGDFANKIGTSGVAVLADYYHIPFYTLGPSSTIDLSTPTGAGIRVEERDPDEIRSMWYAEPMAPAGVPCYNPAFDVTDHSLVTAIVTERGIIYPPFEENLKKFR